MIGFSIGAKLVFPLIRGLAAQITEVTLIAPDGIKENIWYRDGHRKSGDAQGIQVHIAKQPHY
jgi:hypothetical protein